MSLIHRHRPSRPVALSILAILTVAAVACTTTIDGKPIGPPLIASFVTGFQTDGTDLASKTIDEQLEDESDGPVVEVVERATVVNGGSVGQTIESDSEFTKIRLAVAPNSGAGSRSTSPRPSRTGTRTTSPRTTEPQSAQDLPIKGYEEITLDKPTKELDLIVSFPQELPESQFDFFYAIVDDSGKQGPLARQSVEAIEVGTGDVQVSASWDVDSDVDLHVIDPNGDEVYFGNTLSASGGELDLDSNAGCNIDSVRNENITWQDAPAGEYSVRIDYFDACDVDETKYVVTVLVNGKDAKIYSGTLTGSGDTNANGGEEIATFVVEGSTSRPSTSRTSPSTTTTRSSGTQTSAPTPTVTATPSR